MEGSNWVGKAEQATGKLELKQCLEVRTEEPTCSDVFRKRATKPLLKQKQRQKHLTWAKEKNNWIVAQWSKVLFSDKSTFCISFGNQGLESGGRLESHRIQAAWSPVWSFRSQWWFEVPWRMLVLVHCVLSSPKSMQPSTRRFWRTLCFRLLTRFMEMLISFSSRTLAPAHSAKTTSKWFADHDITVLDWPANMPDLNHMKTYSIWNLWDVFKRKMRKSRSTSLRLNSASAVPQADRFHATPHWCCHLS